jgi:flagellar biosynthesis protein
MPETKGESRKQAVAINYATGKDEAPRVVAKGAGLVADNIIAAARQHAVPIYQNKTLASMLMAVELDREIPPELYHAVAQILVYIYRLDHRGIPSKIGG